MSLSLSAARGTIKKIDLDKKAKGNDGQSLLTAIKLEVKTTADILAEFHPELRAAWFKKGGGVRFKSMKEVGWDGTRRGVDLAVRPGPDMQPSLRLADVVLRNFKLKPLEEGGEQMVALRMTIDVADPAARVRLSQLVDYLKEEAWIDINGGGELDLAPPSAGTTIAELDGKPTEDPPPPAAAKPAEVAAVRRLQLTRKGIQAKLKQYHTEVLAAAIEAENQAADCRPMFAKMLEAEIERRTRETDAT